MELLSKELVSSGYSDQLRRDLARAIVCRFLVAYISHEGVYSIGRDLLIAALSDSRSFGVSSLTCSFKNQGVYLQALEEDEGGKLYDNTSHVLVLVWMSEAELRGGNQPVILVCRGTTQKAGPNSQRRGTNQSLDPITGFDAIILDHRQLAAMSNGLGKKRRLVTIWSGQPVEVYDFEFPTSRTNSSQVDGSVRPNYQYHLEVEHVVFPEDGGRPDQPGMVWQRESFAVVNKTADAKIERMPGFLVSPELEAAIKECFKSELSLDLRAAKVLPVSSIDHAKLGKRLSHHPLHDTSSGRTQNANLPGSTRRRNQAHWLRTSRNLRPKTPGRLSPCSNRSNAYFECARCR